MSEGGKKENRDSAEAAPEIEGEAPEAIASEVTATPVPDPNTDTGPDTGPRTDRAESGDDTSPWKLTDEERIGDLEAEVAELKDQLLRAIAETENVRRRGQREREDTAKYAAANFARDILAVADNLARALESVPPEARKENESLETLVTGIELTQRELEAAFERHGIKRIEPMGEPFDHNFHQAMFELEDVEKPAGTVVQLMQPGYLMRDRLLRPAMVGIAKGGPKSAAGGNGGKGGGGKGRGGNGGGEAGKPPNKIDTKV